MASQQTGVMVPTTLNNIDVRFYWIDAGPQRIVQFNYQLSNGTQGNAKTTFTVIGPTQTSVDISTGKILVFKDAEGLELGFGDYLDRSKVGIAFAASAALPSADNGTFLWVQIIKTDKDFLLYPHLFQACTSTPGLDTGFPYLTLGSSNMANDSPYLLLPIDARIVAREFSARMYLMWDPDLPSGCTPPLAPSGATNCSSIPVPIGYADWGFRAEAWNDRLTHQTTKYGWTPYGLLEPSTPFFVASQDFPEWTSYQSADGPISCVTY